MTVREALEKALQPFEPLPRDNMLLNRLAPKIEAALRETAEEMLNYADDYWDNIQSSLTVAERQTAIEKCVTAGIAKMGGET